MFQLAQSMNLQSIYKGKTIEFEGIRARIRHIYDKEDNESASALVSMQKTKFSFFTKSCQVYILIEVSREMYQFDEDGYVLSEKCLMFVRSYFEKCKQESNSHEVVLTFYGRLYYP